MYRIVTLAILVTLCLPAAPLNARQWTDSSGVFTIEAELLDVTGDSVRLRKPDGQVVTVPLDRLSAADRDYARSAGARGQAAAKPALPTREDAIRQKLQQPTKFGFIGTPLCQVLEFLSDQHDVNIQIDRRALDDSGIATDTPVTAPSQQGELGTTFGAVLDSLKLAWIIKHHVLLVTTKDAAEQDVPFRVYKLLRPLRIEDLIADLMRNIAPESWDAVGGPGSVMALPPSVLVISQTQANHRQIEKHYGDLMTPVRSPVPAKSPGLMSDSVAAALEKLTRIEFIETPLTQVVDFLRDRNKLEIKVDENSLADVGIALDVPITMKVKDVRLGSALSLLLAPLDLTWRADQSGIQIMTPEAEASQLQLVFYRVDDLLANSQADHLIEAITSTVAPSTWDEVGGPGSIHLGVRGTLDVRQTFAVHRQVAQLLADLRQAAQK